jgi:exonuclease III
LENWIKKEDPIICSLQETHLIDRNNQGLRVKGWKIYQANGPRKQAGVAILISEKVDFKPTLIKQQRRTLYTNKRGNMPNQNNNYKPICTQRQCTQFDQTYSEGP